MELVEMCGNCDHPVSEHRSRGCLHEVEGAVEPTLCACLMEFDRETGHFPGLGLLTREEVARMDRTRTEPPFWWTHEGMIAGRCRDCGRTVEPRYVTKDSGQRAEFESGMVRDTDEGKARFELLLPEGVPYADQFLTRVAELMARGAVKYNPRNWEKARGTEEMERFKASAIRHLMQWAAGETDEDHAAAVVFNLLGYETTRWRLDSKE